MKEITVDHEDENTAELLTASFENEVNLLSRLEHPNIIDYYQCKRNKNTLQIYMEYLPGGSLSSIIKEFGVMNKSLVAKFTEQIIKALIFIHFKGIFLKF